MRCKIPFIAAAALAALALAVPAPAPAVPLQRLMAPEQACPGQDETALPAAEQERAMRCMTNFARARAGLRPLGSSNDLTGAAGGKAGDILGCDDFSHEACGRDFTYWMQRSGYIGRGCWRAGENIAWGTGRLGGVGAIFDAWMRSPGHRENILGRYAQIGIGLEVGTLSGHSGAAVWVQQFGARC